ncbi:MAG TPA: hypothetical protein VIM73_08005, partial [Polyangiaceae bacterium]
ALLVSPCRLRSSPSSGRFDSALTAASFFPSSSAPARLAAAAHGKLPLFELGHQQAHGTQMDLFQRAVRHGVGEQVARSTRSTDDTLFPRALEPELSGG